MTRPDGSHLKGETQLIEEESWAWTDAPGHLWYPKGKLPDDEAGRLPRLIVYPLILLMGMAIWIIGIWALWGWLS